jgi:hypothetical protein
MRESPLQGHIGERDCSDWQAFRQPRDPERPSGWFAAAA